MPTATTKNLIQASEAIGFIHFWELQLPTIWRLIW